MKALVFNGNLKLQDLPIPELGEGEALIRVIMAGICNTDLEIIRGYMGFRGILGHEFIGEVLESDQIGWIGKRIVGEINIQCGDCENCLKGLGRHCLNRTVLGILKKDGAFAEYLILPVQNLVLVPDSISDVEAVFTEPLAAACEILEQIHIEPMHKVAVIGDGKLGQLIVGVLRLSNCRLTVFGKSNKKLKLLESLGVDTYIYDSKINEKFDIVVEASGSVSGFNLALDLVKPRGTFILKSTIQEEICFNTAKLVINEINLIGSRCGRFEPALRLLQDKLLNVIPMVSKIYSLLEWEKAFREAERPETLKIILSMEE